MPEEENYLARSISQAGMEARYDESVKRLLANKMILATIMKECLEEYHLCTVEEIAEKYIEGEPQVGKVGVHTDETHPAAERKNTKEKNISAGQPDGTIHGTATEDVTRTEGTVQYDIRFTALAPGKEELIRLIINIEAQNRFHPGYPLLKRAIYQIGESFPYLINAPRRCAGIRRCMMPAKAAPNPAPSLASES